MTIESEKNRKGITSAGGWDLGMTTTTGSSPSSNHNAKPCESCTSSPALLFCRADSAFLCGPCDANIHSVNKLASRHERVLVCEVCEQAPAAVTCKADAASLCSICDRDIHSANPLARRHHRLPILPLFPNRLNSSHHVDHDKDNDAADASADAWLVGASKQLTSDFLYSEVYPLLDFNYAAPDLDIKPLDSSAGDGVVPGFAAKPESLKLSLNHHPPSDSYFEVSSSDVGVVPDDNGNSMPEMSDNYRSSSSKPAAVDSAAPLLLPQQLSREEREARVMRYREKRKNRKFEKKIRYASRKAYAETRPRIKGRFAKRTEIEDGYVIDHHLFGAGDGGYSVSDHGGFGVVPTF